MQSSKTVSTKQERIAKLAREAPDMAFTSLSHHIDIDWLREAYRRTRKSGAPGVDGRTGEEYGQDLEGNLESLLGRAKSGNYRAPPVRRVEIPKGRGKTRPIGIPTFEDKVLQRAVLMALEPIYEQDFLGCSYGFRPRRSAHDAVEALWRGLMEMGGGWVLEVDIQGFFENLDHRTVQDLVRKRVRDGVLKRLIGKWLNAGVQQDGVLQHRKSGTPQGGVISPLLANIYLHETLDTWVEHDVRPRMSGRMLMVRYADDLVLVFERRDDAERVQAVLPKRLGKFGLTLHPDKTRLVEFRRPSQPGRGPKGSTFDFLGFTHYWGLSRKGRPVVRRKTAKDRFRRALREVAEWCRRHRHTPIEAQATALTLKLRGHYSYYGITHNMRTLHRFYKCVCWRWLKWLRRRSQNSTVPLARFLEKHASRLPTPRIVHSAVT